MDLEQLLKDETKSGIESIQFAKNLGAILDNFYDLKY